MKIVCLFDADIIAFKYASVCEYSLNWGDGIWTRHADFNEALEAMEAGIAAIEKELDADESIICLSDKRNFRYDVYPDYKHNRKDSYRPMLLNPLKEYLAENYTTFQRPQLEADDVMGILATRKQKEPTRFIIISTDKDLKQIPSHHYNPDKRQLTLIEKAEGDYFFYTQCLTGDVTDGYPGCPGMGPVSARKLLDSAESESDVWPLIVAAYAKKGLSEEYALEQARCARILQASDYDFKNKRVKYWTPQV